VNISADDLLGRIRRDYPTQYQLCQLQLIIEMQDEEIQRLRAELQAARDTPDPATDVPLGDASMFDQPRQGFHLRAAAPPEPQHQDDER
jgi:hypothetical protein